MREQQKVSKFIESNGLESPPEFRLLDLVSELGEVTTDAVESTGYGDHPETIAVETDEIGDAGFAVLALADALDIDAGTALDAVMAKYANRLDGGYTPASGR